MATAASNVAFGGGGGYGDIAAPTRRRRHPVEEEQTAPLWRSRVQRQPADEVEVFLFPLKGPVRDALSRLMDMLETVVDDPVPIQLSVVSGPLGYMASIRSIRPGILPEPAPQFRPVVR